MRMDENQPEPQIPVDLFAIRPDTKGPKSIGVLLILGALVLFSKLMAMLACIFPRTFRMKRSN